MHKKVADLTGAELDYWVAKAEGDYQQVTPNMISHYDFPAYSTDWALGGPIIVRENIQLTPPTSRVHRNGGPQSGWGHSGVWSAVIWERGANGRRPWAYHETSPLIAAMRCFVASRLGNEVRCELEIPPGVFLWNDAAPKGAK